MARIYVDKYVGKLERTDLYFVKLTMKDGTVYENLEPRMLFPITNQTMFITLLDKNEKEFAFVRDLTELDEDSAQALRDCFHEYYMIPKIQKVLSCNERTGALSWTVLTDRGEVSFQIRNHHSDIKHLRGTKRVIIRDSNDNRYEIEDYTTLDRQSAHFLFAYI